MAERAQMNVQRLQNAEEGTDAPRSRDWKQAAQAAREAAQERAADQENAQERRTKRRREERQRKELTNGGSVGEHIPLSPRDGVELLRLGRPEPTEPGRQPLQDVMAERAQMNVADNAYRTQRRALTARP